MSIFLQWLEDGDSKKALWSLIERKKRQKLENRLDYLVSAINLYEKRQLDWDTKKTLNELLPYIESDEEVSNVLKNTHDIGKATMVLAQRYKVKPNFHILAALSVLAVASSLPTREQSQSLISQARKLGAMTRRKVDK